MINIHTIQSLTERQPALIPDITKTWKIGQVLNATAENSLTPNDKILLRIGPSLLEAKTPVALKTGESFKLLVKSLGDVPVLKIQTMLNSIRPPAGGTTQVAAQNLKNFIAQQQDLTGLLQLSKQLIENPTIPKTLKQQLTQLNQQLPGFERATQAKTLKNLIQNNGVFLESKIKSLQNNTQKQTVIQQDIKTQLLKINAQLNTALPGLIAKTHTIITTPTSTNINTAIEPLVKQFIKGEISLAKLATALTIQLPERHNQLIQQVLTTSDNSLLPKELKDTISLLLSHIQQQPNPKQIRDNLSSLLKTMESLQELKTGIEGALAKITSQQLTVLTREPDSLLLLLFDLYLKHKNEHHLIQFQIEQEQSSSDPDTTDWNISLNFNFKELGPIQAKLHLSGNAISTVFRAEQKATAQTISKEVHLLDAALQRIGFNVIKMDVTQGSIIEPRNIPKNVRLLDEKV